MLIVVIITLLFDSVDHLIAMIFHRRGYPSDMVVMRAGGSHHAAALPHHAGKERKGVGHAGSTADIMHAR